MFISSVRRIYLASALVVTNLLVALLAVNILLGLIFFVLDTMDEQEAVRQTEGSPGKPLFNQDGSPTSTRKRTPYQTRWFDYSAYEDIGDIYAAEVLDDFYQLTMLGFVYQPWVQFSEPPFQGKRVNIDVDEKGFPARRTINVPHSQGLPVIRIFVLGGSTTFGYNVSDEHTWPSQLSRILNEHAYREGLRAQVEVSNYGRGFYYPSQETALAVDLLRLGYRPDLVIFMDGVNTGTPEDFPWFTQEFSRRFDYRQFARNIADQLRWVPIVRLAYVMRHQLFDTNTDTQLSNPTPEILVNRFLQNREISKTILDYYAVPSLFFIQPDAIFNYPLHLYRFPLPESALRSRKERVEFYNDARTRKGAIVLSNLFELWGADRKAIVDECHYSPNFNRFLAEHVARHIDLKSLLHVDKSHTPAPTGVPRVLSRTSEAIVDISCGSLCDRRTDAR